MKEIKELLQLQLDIIRLYRYNNRVLERMLTKYQNEELFHNLLSYEKELIEAETKSYDDILERRWLER